MTQDDSGMARHSHKARPPVGDRRRSGALARRRLMVRHPGREAIRTRVLEPEDAAAVRRILATSEYTHSRIDTPEIARLLELYPACGMFSVPAGPLGRVGRGSLLAYLLLDWLVPPSAWIGSFGVTWSQADHFQEHLDALLDAIESASLAKGARALYYSGADVANDWLREPLEARGFRQIALLRSYDKTGFDIPSFGNMAVRVRLVRPEDIPALVALEQLCFAQPWRHDASSFAEVARTYPYFVVAEDRAGRLIGYQFNTVDASAGYLVRIAVHPRVSGQGIGARLMADAVRYFASQHVQRIVLNTEDTNARAHALYEHFGFLRVEPTGFVLQRNIESR